MIYLLFSLVGYLLGSVLFCYYLPLWFMGIDITKNTPDHNPGAFNCISSAGWIIGIPALILDLLKGAVPVFAAARLSSTASPAFILVMMAPVLGHAFSIFNCFKGGKAITVSFGVLLGLLPFWRPAVLLAIIYIFFSAVVRVYPNRTRSMLVFFCFGVLSVVWLKAGSVSFGCAANSAIVFFKHKFSPKVHQSFVRPPVFSEKFLQR